MVISISSTRPEEEEDRNPDIREDLWESGSEPALGDIPKGQQESERRTEDEVSEKEAGSWRTTPKQAGQTACKEKPDEADLFDAAPKIMLHIKQSLWRHD